MTDCCKTKGRTITKIEGCLLPTNPVKSGEISTSSEECGSKRRVRRFKKENGTRNAPTPAKSAGDSNPIGPSCPKKLRLEPEAKVMKRHDYISWNDYFMAVSMLSAQRSKDPSTQVGACIVNEAKKIVGIGYNGFPNGCNDDVLPWNRKSESGELHTKYPYVCHAEMNAIMNKNCESLIGCTMYVALFPCNECAKLVIQSGIRTVYYLSDKYHDLTPFIASRRLFDMAGVRYVQYKPTLKKITIDFDSV